MPFLDVERSVSASQAVGNRVGERASALAAGDKPPGYYARRRRVRRLAVAGFVAAVIGVFTIAPDGPEGHVPGYNSKPPTTPTIPNGSVSNR